MRPRLDPTRPLLWRDRTTLQLGIDPGRALVVHGATPEVLGFVRGLDGLSTSGTAIARAADAGLGPTVATDLLDVLTDAGAVTDATDRPTPHRRPSGIVAVEGRGRLATATSALLVRCGVRTAGARAGRAPALTVLAPQAWPDVVRARDLARSGRTHLPVSLVDGIGTVGPLVVPGRGACLRCVELHHTDRDPRWPLLLAQLTERAAPPVEESMAALLAALTVRLVLGHLEGRSPDGAAYVVTGADPAPRRRSYPPHPRCGCWWDRAPDAGGGREGQ